MGWRCLAHDDGAEILAKKPGDAPVSALAWSATGSKLAFAFERKTARREFDKDLR